MCNYIIAGVGEPRRRTVVQKNHSDIRPTRSHDPPFRPSNLLTKIMRRSSEPHHHLFGTILPTQTSSKAGSVLRHLKSENTFNSLSSKQFHFVSHTIHIWSHTGFAYRVHWGGEKPETCVNRLTDTGPHDIHERSFNLRETLGTMPKSVYCNKI